MKAWCTYLCYEGVEIIRQSCGGAGFSLHSGLAHLVQDYAPQVTVEGDNMVMAQINAKYLLKELGKIMGGNEPKSEYLAYLKDI